MMGLVCQVCITTPKDVVTMPILWLYTNWVKVLHKILVIYSGTVAVFTSKLHTYKMSYCKWEKFQGPHGSTSYQITNCTVLLL